MIDGQQVRGWVRDGLLADLTSDPAPGAGAGARARDQFRIGGPGETVTRAVPLAVTRGVHTTGLYYNQAILDEAGVDASADDRGPEGDGRSRWRSSVRRRSSIARATCSSTRS